MEGVIGSTHSCALPLWSSSTDLWVRPPEERERLNSSECNRSESRILFMSNHWREGGPRKSKCVRLEVRVLQESWCRAEERGVWGSPATRPALGGSRWKPICGWKCSSPRVHSHRKTRPVIKGARGQDGPLIWGCGEKGGPALVYL